MISDHLSLPQIWDTRQLRVFYAFGLMIVGVLYPEDKTLIAGVHWPPFAAAIGLIIMVALKRKLMDGLVLSIWMVLWALSVIGCSLVLGVIGINEGPELEFVLRHYLTLLITTIVSFLLVSDLSVRLILQGIFRFGLTLAVILLVVRVSLFDFSREGAFLGLGPLTFAKYVCVGWIAQIAHDRRLRILPALVFALALVVADSKGPIMFLMITMVVFIFVSNGQNRWRPVLFILGFVLLISMSGRFVSFGTDVISFVTGELILPNTVEFEAQAEDELINGTVARMVAMNSSIEFISKQPLTGWGMGSWPQLTGLYHLEYPHNSILEIWFEYGLFGIAVFIYFARSAVCGVFRKNPFSLFVIFCGLLSLTTGSIRDLRLLIFFIMLTYRFMHIYRKTYIKNAYYYSGN